ncbi:DUF2177 family protein [Candidatus Shapirobacteria bacterium]|nr:DUF2177 family protein [Candidatus Shapirobacteria bacterium]
MIKLYFLTLTVFLGIDAIWLTVVAKKFYAQHLAYVMAKSPNLVAALIFYLLFVVGMVVLILVPAIEKKSLMQAILTGALFGLVSYATYDLTNLATIYDWPILVTVVDMIWGTVLSATVAGVSFWIYQLISK